MGRIDAVTFDFWNTLYVEDLASLDRRRDRRVSVAQAYFVSAGKRLESKPVRAALEATLERISAMRRDEHRAAGHAEVGEMLAAALGFRLDYDDARLLAEGISSAGRDHPPMPADGAGMLLESLCGAVKLAVISDTGLTFGMHLRQVMANHGLAEYFQQFTWSDETLTTKPAARQFLYTVHMLDVPPDRAVHVGDLEAADIGGARQVGMRTIRLGDASVASEADAVAESLADALDVLRQWGAKL
ncbi:MAG: HAD family hydrolase [Planctomycetota bacterium]